MFAPIEYVRPVGGNSPKSSDSLFNLHCGFAPTQHKDTVEMAFVAIKTPITSSIVQHATTHNAVSGILGIVTKYTLPDTRSLHAELDIVQTTRPRDLREIETREAIHACSLWLRGFLWSIGRVDLEYSNRCYADNAADVFHFYKPLHASPWHGCFVKPSKERRQTGL